METLHRYYLLSKMVASTDEYSLIIQKPSVYNTLPLFDTMGS